MNSDLFNKLSDEQLKQQVSVILGYAPDTIQVDTATLAYCFANFFNIFKIDDDKKFNISQKNSLDCILGKKTYSQCIDSLAVGNKNSFIISPLATAPHISFCVIYKSKDGSSFNCTVLNKQGDSPRTYTQYTIPYDNMQNIIDCLGYETMQFNTIDQFSSIFEKNASKVSDLDFVCCLDKENSEVSYITELEAALNFTYSKNFLFKYFKTNNSSIKGHNNWDVNSEKSTSFNIVGPFSTAKIHEKFLNNIKLKRPNLTSYIDNLTDIKKKNSIFNGKFPEDNDLKMAEFFFKIAFDYDKTNNLTDCIMNVDAKTLATNFDFIYHLCNKNKLDNYVKALDILEPILSGPSADLSDFIDNLDTLKALFPSVVSQLSCAYSNSYLIQSFDTYNRAMNTINDMLNIAQNVNDNLAVNEVYDKDEYSDEQDYYTPYTSYPDNKLNILTNIDNHSNEHDQKYYTPYDDTFDENSQDGVEQKHTSNSLYRHPSNGSISFSDIYNLDDIDNVSDTYMDINDYLEPETFMDNVNTLLNSSVDMCKVALTIEPNNAFCHYILGMSLLYLGEHEDAQIAFNHACDLTPTNNVFQTMHAVSLVLNDKIDHAKSIVKIALEIEPDNEDAKMLNNILSSTDDMDEIKDTVIDLYKINYQDISLSLSSMTNTMSYLDRNFLNWNNKFAYVPLLNSRDVSLESLSNNLVRSYSSFSILNKPDFKSNLFNSKSLSNLSEISPPDTGKRASDFDKRPRNNDKNIKYKSFDM